MEAFVRLASEVLQSEKGRGDADLLDVAFQRATGRKPKQSELGALLSAVEESRAFYAQNLEEAEAFVSVGESVAVPESDEQKVELAALSSVVQIIMNTDEFMTRE